MTGTSGTCKFNGGRANLKSAAEERKHLPLIGLRNGLDRLLNKLFPSEECAKTKFNQQIIKSTMVVNFELVSEILKFDASN